jgi:aminocarboxymuconate-semialdehyde decarboxylase
VTAIDVHAHILLKESLREMYAAHPDVAHELIEKEGQHYLRYPDGKLAHLPSSMFDIDERIAAMDRQGVQVQAMAIQPRQYHYNVPGQVGADFSRIQNERNIELSRSHPERLHVMLTLPMQDAGLAIKEIDRVGSIPTVRGIQTGGNINGTNLDSPDLDPIWAALADADLPVLMHPGITGMAAADRLRSYGLINLIGNPLETTIAIASLIFGGVLERHPDLRFGFVHGGGFAPYQTGRWDHGWADKEEAQESIKVAPTKYFRRMFFDTLTHDRDSLEFLGKRVGWHQVFIGTDYPFGMGDRDPVGHVMDLHLDDQTTEAVLSANAHRFLRPLPA